MREGHSEPVPERNAPKELDTSVRQNVVNFRAPFLEHRKQEVGKVLEWLRANAGDSASGDSPLARVLALCDVSRLFCGGHSFGACQTVIVAADPELRAAFRAAILLDLWPEPLPDEVLDAGVQLPVLSVASEHFADLPMSAHSSRLLANSAACHSFYAAGSIHEDFSDFPFLLRTSTMRRFVNKKSTGPPREAQAATVAAIVAHLAAHGGPGAGEAWTALLARHGLLRPFPKCAPPGLPLAGGLPVGPA
jgi:hypothetical protein